MSVQDMIKKSVLESGVFDSFNASKMAISLIVALLLGAVIYMVYSKFYVGVIFSAEGVRQPEGRREGSGGEVR